MLSEIIKELEEKAIQEMEIEEAARETHNAKRKTDPTTGVTKIPLNRNTINRYKNTREGSFLSRFSINSTTQGYMLIKQGKIVGAVSVERSNDGNRWISELEVGQEFRNKGFGKILLSHAKQLGGTNITVPKTNNELLHLVLTNGFTAYRDTGLQYLFSTKNMGAKLPVKDPYAKKESKQQSIKESVSPDLYRRMYTESVTLNEDDTVINLENFESGLYNFLLVIGLPGSGKGCIGRELAKKYNANHLEIDVFDQCGNMSEEEIRKAGEPFTSYVLDDPNGNWYWKNAKTLSVNEKLQGNKKFIEYVIAYAKSHRNEIFVIDGTPIYAAMEPEDIKNYPLIIKGTSAKHSFQNKVGRDVNDKSSDRKLHSKVSPKHLEGLLQYYWGDAEALNKFKNEFITVSDEAGDGVVDHPQE